MIDQDYFYKVIDAESRRSTNWSMIKRRIREEEGPTRHLIHPPKGYRRFFPLYKPGKKVNALPGSIGLFLFTNYAAAREFMYNYHLERVIKIIRVYPCDEINRKVIHYGLCGTDIYCLKNQLEHKSRGVKEFNPYIVTCMSVRVID